MANPKETVAPGDDLSKFTPGEQEALKKFQDQLVADQAAEIEALKLQLQATQDTANAAVAGAPVVSIDKAKYKVVHGVQRMKDGAMVKYTPQQIAANKELAAELLKLGSTAIVAI